MTYNPDSLRVLGAYWTEQGGVNLGVVGDTNHLTGYHLGRDRIYDGSGPGQGDNDYSVRHPRDKAGLTNAASAIDLGKLNGSYPALYEFSDWLARQVAARAPGAQDIREVIYSPDGHVVQRMSGIDGQIHTGEGNGDLSHRTHTHISYFRDSEERDKVALFARYFETEDDDDMALNWYPIPRPTGPLTIKTERPNLVNLVTGKWEKTTDLVKTSLGGVHLVEPWGGDPNMQDGYLVRHRQQAWVALDGVVATPPESPSTPAPGPHSHNVSVDVDGQKVEGSVTYS